MHDGEKAEVRIVLVGKTGSGKSAIGNTILGKNAFQPHMDSPQQVEDYKKDMAVVNGRKVAVIDTPGLYSTRESENEVNEEIGKCKSLMDPGPHVFLVVTKPGLARTGDEDTVKIIQKAFGEDAARYTMVLLTHEDNVNNEGLSHLLQQCGGRYSVLNPQSDDKTQVQNLLKKIDEMIKNNGGSYYTIPESVAGAKNPGEFLFKEFCFHF